MPKIIENAKEIIISEGRRLLLEKSYSELNIREIARNCEIGIGTIYNYFKTKDEIVYAIFNDDWFKVLDIIRTLEQDTRPLKEKFRTIYASMEEFLDKYISVFYELSMTNGSSHGKGCPDENSHNFSQLYKKSEELLLQEQKQAGLHSTLTPKELSSLVMSNLIYLCKTKYTSFDKLYDSLII